MAGLPDLAREDRSGGIAHSNKCCNVLMGVLSHMFMNAAMY